MGFQWRIMDVSTGFRGFPERCRGLGHNRRFQSVQAHFTGSWCFKSQGISRGSQINVMQFQMSF